MGRRSSSQAGRWVCPKRPLPHGVPQLSNLILQALTGQQRERQGSVGKQGHQCDNKEA